MDGVTEKRLRRAHRWATALSALFTLAALLLVIIDLTHDGPTTVPVLGIGAAGQAAAALACWVLRWLIGGARAWHATEAAASRTRR